MTLMVNESSYCKTKKIRQIVAIMITLIVLVGGINLRGANAQSLDESYNFLPSRVARLVNTATEAFVVSPETPVIAEDMRVTAIRTYFENLNMPAAAYAEAFVRAADENGLAEWSLLPAIARWETTGCKYTLENPHNSRLKNCFGFGPTGYSFNSIEEGIEYVTATLAGNKEQTDHYYAKDKTLEQKLHHYNSVKKGYAERTLATMASIESLATVKLAMNQ